MQKVLIAGASGALGLEVLKKLREKEIPVRALIHTPESVDHITPYTDDVFIADVRNNKALIGVCKGIKIVFSAMGKSVSLFKTSLSSYEEVDLHGNRLLLYEAVKSGVNRFIYTSIKGADTDSHLEVARVHKSFQDLLESADLNYTIIQPVGFFSGMNDLLIMGKRGVIPIPGSGNNKTNSIHEKDLAQVVVDHLYEGPEKMEVGGPELHTRNEMMQMISEKTKGKVVHVPKGLIKAGILPLFLVKKGLAANLEYFKFVTTNDMIAPKYGSITMKDYLDSIDLNQLP